jgi:ATP adenylyltransferase
VNEQRTRPHTLWAAAVAATARARASGALQPIATTETIVEEQGIPWRVRVLAGPHGRAALRAKEVNANVNPNVTPSVNPNVDVGAGMQERRTGPPFDPFLPYDPDLLVAEMGPGHVWLLNKFNVIHNHLLLVTRAFEEQEQAIGAEDFAALWAGMAEIDGLAFYNAGPLAGASQRHKHLQLTPLPWGPGDGPLPVEEALAVGTLRAEPQVRAWPYVHAAVALEPQWLEAPADAGGPLAARYAALLQALGIEVDARGRPGPYNLLCTRRWMVVVRRRAEMVEGIAVNALGFAGSLLVRSEAQLAHLREVGVLGVLRAVGGG